MRAGQTVLKVSPVCLRETGTGGRREGRGGKQEKCGAERDLETLAFSFPFFFLAVIQKEKIKEERISERKGLSRATFSCLKLRISHNALIKKVLSYDRKS